MFNLFRKKKLSAEQQYIKLLKELIQLSIDTQPRADRTGVGCVSLFGKSIKFDLRDGFPLLTTKKIWFEFVVEELSWFLSGSTNCNDLPPKMKHLWSPWADDNGYLGPIYGEQFRGRIWGDQFIKLINGLITDPYSRRHVMSTWNAADVPHMRLSPCHGTVIQFFIDGDYIDMVTLQRSGDIFLGVPFNLASYSLLLHLVANAVGKTAREVTYHFGDLHLYSNHKMQALDQVYRKVKKVPTISFNRKYSVGELKSHSIKNKIIKYSDICLENYEPDESIKAPLAI